MQWPTYKCIYWLLLNAEQMQSICTREINSTNFEMMDFKSIVSEELFCGNFGDLTEQSTEFHNFIKKVNKIALFYVKKISKCHFKKETFQQKKKHQSLSTWRRESCTNHTNTSAQFACFGESKASLTRNDSYIWCIWFPCFESTL